MLRSMLSVIVLMIAGSSVSAAIIYEAPNYEYRDPHHDGPTFYYGGSNPLVLAYGRMYQARYNTGVDPQRNVAATEGHYGYNLVHTGLIGNAPFVFSDRLPAGVNAFPYGFSVSDARDQAYRSIPLSFRMADLRGYPDRDGNIIVPAHQSRGLIDIHPMAPTTQPASAPTTEPILIIPKGLLNKPLNSKASPVASAR